jgi:hypothetical protein
MPVDSSGPPAGEVPNCGGNSRDEPHAGAAEPGGPTLAALLHSLTGESPGEPVPPDPLSAALRHVRSRSSVEPLGLEVAGVLRSGMLQAIRRELGGQIGDMAVRSMSGKPLTRRNAERILRAAVELSTARRAVPASVVSASAARAQMPSHAALNGNGHGGNGAAPGGWAADSAGLERPRSMTAEQSSAASVPRLEEIVRPLLEGRHEALLRQCVEITRGGFQSPSARHAIGEAAAQLHDRVRTFLEKQGRWPIQDPAEYESYAKPAAIVMAAWEIPITLDDP